MSHLIGDLGASGFYSMPDFVVAREREVYFDGASGSISR